MVSSMVLTVVLAALSFRSDYHVTYLLRGKLDDQLDRLATSETTPNPVSMRSTREIMLACGEILSLSARPANAPPLAEATAAACARIADRILSVAPTNARALALALLADPDRMTSAALARARAAAPLEPWPLIIRIAAVTRTAPLRPDLATEFLPDVAQALGTAWGRDRIVALYATRPDLRDPIRHAAATLGPEDQAAFLHAVRKLVQGGA